MRWHTVQSVQLFPCSSSSISYHVLEQGQSQVHLIGCECDRSIPTIPGTQPPDKQQPPANPLR
eukprot:766195-Hanusia_phi.AAC.14